MNTHIYHTATTECLRHSPRAPQNAVLERGARLRRWGEAPAHRSPYSEIVALWLCLLWIGRTLSASNNSPRESRRAGQLTTL